MNKKHPFSHIKPEPSPHPPKKKIKKRLKKYSRPVFYRPSIFSYETYEIQRIVDFKIMKGKRHYLIKWKNYPESDNTWQPLSNLYSIALDILQFQHQNQEQIKKVEHNWHQLYQERKVSFLLDKDQIRKVIKYLNLGRNRGENHKEQKQQEKKEKENNGTTTNPPEEQKQQIKEKNQEKSDYLEIGSLQNQENINIQDILGYDEEQYGRFLLGGSDSWLQSQLNSIHNNNQHIVPQQSNPQSHLQQKQNELQLPSLSQHNPNLPNTQKALQEKISLSQDNHQPNNDSIKSKPKKCAISKAYRPGGKYHQDSHYFSFSVRSKELIQQTELQQGQIIDSIVHWLKQYNLFQVHTVNSTHRLATYDLLKIHCPDKLLQFLQANKKIHL